MLVARVVDLFLAWNAEHRSAATVRQYRGKLTPFVGEFGAREFSSLSPLEIEAWLRQIARFPADHPKAGELKAPDTRRQNVIAIERLQRWAVERKELAAPILDKIEKPRGKLRQRIPTDDETARILRSADPTFALIYQALRQSGARPNELAKATLDDYDRANGRIVLADHKTARKTGKDRVIPVGEKLAAILEQSTAGREGGGEHLFLNRLGRPWTVAGLGSYFRRLRRKLRLPEDLVLYLTRHEHGTKICEKLGIHAASEALGHASLQTTKRYVHADAETLRKNQDAFGE